MDFFAYNNSLYFQYDLITYIYYMSVITCEHYRAQQNLLMSFCCTSVITHKHDLACIPERNLHVLFRALQENTSAIVTIVKLAVSCTVAIYVLAANIYIYIYLYPTEAILQRHLQCNISDIRQVLGNNYLLGSYSPVQCLIW